MRFLFRLLRPSAFVGGFSSVRLSWESHSSAWCSNVINNRGARRTMQINDQGIRESQRGRVILTESEEWGVTCVSGSWFSGSVHPKIRFFAFLRHHVTMTIMSQSSCTCAIPWSNDSLHDDTKNLETICRNANEEEIWNSWQIGRSLPRAVATDPFLFSYQRRWKTTASKDNNYR